MPALITSVNSQLATSADTSRFSHFVKLSDSGRFTESERGTSDKRADGVRERDEKVLEGRGG